MGENRSMVMLLADWPALRGVLPVMYTPSTGVIVTCSGT
jgi:hypothetical protein